MKKEACCSIEDFTKAIGDITRHKILVLLQEQEMNVGEITGCLNVSQPTISHHLAILSRSRLVTSRREGKFVYYQANQACVVECCGGIFDRFHIIESNWKDHNNNA